MDIKNRLVILEELVEELKAAEKVLDGSKDFGLSDEYKRGFRRALFVSIEKAFKLSIFAEIEDEEESPVFDLAKMKVASNSIN